jgi:argonaute-like protein implicated in RNA metabolism and viral defense
MVMKVDRFYDDYKNIFYANNIISQVVTARNIRKANLSVASNILRQINSKIGGDLYNLQFSPELSPNTMLLGIDVCHKGRNSIVGFCASINENMSQYYSQHIVQPRGQEIVDKELS